MYRRLARLRELKKLDDFRQELGATAGGLLPETLMVAAHDGDSLAVCPVCRCRAFTVTAATWCSPIATQIVAKRLVSQSRGRQIIDL
ncbi:MAG: hypothetical protein U0792_15635 [Gemmataceae bacterium]